MQHIVYDSSAESFPIALLVKDSAFNGKEIDNTYVKVLESKGIRREDIIIVALKYQKGKAPSKLIKEHLAMVMGNLASVGCKTVYCADANYFKVLAKQRKAEPHLGYSFKCGLEGYEHIDVTLGINHKSLLYDPKNEPKLELSLDTLADMVNGSYEGLGNDIIKNARYLSDRTEIRHALEELKQHPRLAADIEGFSLDFDKAGIATIAFAWSNHEGIAFPVDYKPHLGNAADEHGHCGQFVVNQEIRTALREFFESYEGELVWHNANYDLKAIINALWMENLKDVNGMLQGLDIMCEGMQDTKIITYLATNSTAGNDLKLKNIAHSFAGNWAQDEDDIKDIRRIPLPDLLQYNLVDSLSTYWTFDKYYPVMVKDQQEDIYINLMQPSQKTIIQAELTGMPLDPVRVQEVKKELSDIVAEQEAIIRGTATVTQLEELQTERAYIKDYESRRDKAKNPDKIKWKDRDTFPQKVFNPNSDPQCQTLLYEVMGLPVIDLTKGKQPATGGDTLEKLVNHTDNEEYIAIINALMSLSEADKILTSFIPAFEQAIEKGDDVVWLHGNFNLGGTVSGRLSSSGPNLQNLPSGSTYGKLIKSCFRAPKGWIFCGADFASLEDRINALLTKDPNKLKVYTDGFDGHALRAYSYWPDQFPDIDPTDPASINSIKKKDHPLRQKSKVPTFALTYQGTYLTLMKNSGFSEDEAKQVESSYHELYAASTQWVKDRIQQACQDGYATAAFGLRIRTPLLGRSILGNAVTTREAEAEARTLGNAISGQSYGLLTNRSMNAVMERVWASKYRFDILPVAMIHDASYFVVRDDVEVVEWLNNVLVEEMQWQELPEISHDEVKLGAELDLFHPTWAHGITLPNAANQEEILAVCNQAMTELKEAA